MKTFDTQQSRVWVTVDIDATANRYQNDRARVVTALEYFSDKQYIELQSKQKEANEINRISQMISFFESSDCISLKLARYFGEISPGHHQQRNKSRACRVQACYG